MPLLDESEVQDFWSALAAAGCTKDDFELTEIEDTSLDKIMGDVWVVVNKVATSPAAFILLPSEVRELAKRGEKEGRVSYWLQPTSYDQETFKEGWERIGHG